MGPLRPGKVPGDVIEPWLETAPGPEVRRGPAVGEDAALIELARVRAVVLDMDGTLMRSRYDWPEIRRRLGITGRSILDELEALPEPTRSVRRRELEAVEQEATRTARLEPGARELLEAFRRSGLRTALVTNNTEANARELLERFDLDFDVVLTRDTGLWKPSAAPLVEALRRLGVAPARALAVGDSAFDLEAGRAAGCALVAVVNGGHDTLRHLADLSFPDLAGLARCLGVVRP